MHLPRFQSSPRNCNFPIDRYQQETNRNAGHQQDRRVPYGHDGMATSPPRQSGTLVGRARDRKICCGETSVMRHRGDRRGRRNGRRRDPPWKIGMATVPSGCAPIWMLRLPAEATSGVPNTGAETYPRPRRLCISASSSANSGEIVAVTTWTMPARADLSTSVDSSTARIASSSANSVKTTSVCSASATVWTTVTGAISSTSTLLRF